MRPPSLLLSFSPSLLLSFSPSLLSPSLLLCCRFFWQEEHGLPLDHLGPTNSGKTFDALEFLAARGSRVHAGPLRLLALEACDKLRRKLGHTKVGCKTGEEEDLPDADVLCCTAECAPESGDTLVLDEVPWLVDEGRGHVRAP